MKEVGYDAPSEVQLLKVFKRVLLALDLAEANTPIPARMWRKTHKTMLETRAGYWTWEEECYWILYLGRAEG